MTIDDVRNLANIKKNQLISIGESTDKINIAIELLKDDMCFFKVDINIMIPILIYIGISEEKVKDVYFDLISIKNFNSNYKIRNGIEM